MPCWLDGETEAQGVVCIAQAAQVTDVLDKPQL